MLTKEGQEVIGLLDQRLGTFTEKDKRREDELRRRQEEAEMRIVEQDVNSVMTLLPEKIERARNASQFLGMFVTDVHDANDLRPIDRRKIRCLEERLGIKGRLEQAGSVDRVGDSLFWGMSLKTFRACLAGTK